jgi:hypothetical protein
MSKIKIAYVLSGQPRYIEQAGLNQTALLIKELRSMGYVVDVFAQTWNDSLSLMTPPNGNLAEVKISQKRLKKRIVKTYNPVNTLIESFYSTCERLQKDSIIEHIPSFTGQHMAFINALEMVSDEYDYVIKSRYDLLVSPVVAHYIGKVISNWWKDYHGNNGNALFSPKVRFDRGAFFTDIFFFGNTKFLKNVYNYDTVQRMNNVCRLLKQHNYDSVVENMIYSQNSCYTNLITFASEKINNEVNQWNELEDKFKLYRYWTKGYNVLDWESMKHLVGTR